MVIEGSGLHGTLPLELCHATNLVKLYLSGNQFDSLPSCVTHLQRLQDLYVSQNQLEGELPYALDNMTELRKLDLSEAKVNRPRPRKKACCM